MSTKNSDNIYTSLDDARNEVVNRWNDTELKEKVRNAIGTNFMDFFLQKTKPSSVLFRQLITPDNGFEFFLHLSNYISVHPVVVEYLSDKFVSFNEEKKAYGRLKIKNKGDIDHIDIINFHENERKKIEDIKLLDGSSLVEFHHNLINKAGYSNFTIIDNSRWFKNIGAAKDYYYYFLLHFISEGVLFETFADDPQDSQEYAFTEQVILPNIKRIENEFSLKPLIVKMYPDNQSEEDDLYWWSYPGHVNDLIIKYSESEKFINNI